MEDKVTRDNMRHTHNTISMMKDVIDLKIFDVKRMVFRILSSIKTERGDKIKEISNRRRARNMKLVPFLVYSCQKHLQRHRQYAVKQAFLNIFFASIKSSNNTQTVYQIKKDQSEAKDTHRIRDVSANLKDKFDSSVAIPRSEAIKDQSHQSGPLKIPVAGRKSPVPNKEDRSSRIAIHKPTLTPRDTSSRQVKKISVKGDNGGKEGKNRVEKSMIQHKKGSVNTDSTLGSYNDAEKRPVSLSVRVGNPGEIKTVSKNVYRAFKMLSLLISIKQKNYRKIFLNQTRKMNTERIRKIISIYKRRHFISAEKTLTNIKMNLMRTGLSMIRSKRVVLITKEMNNMRQVLLVDTINRLCIQSLSRCGFVSIFNSRMREEDATSRQKSSTDQLGSFIDDSREMQVQPLKKKIMRSLNHSVDQIRGFKKTKKSFTIGILLFFLFKNKHQEHKSVSLEKLKACSSRMMILQNGIGKLTHMFDGFYLRNTYESFYDIIQRANYQRNKNTTYLVDLLHVIFKRRVLGPTFYYFKFDYTRIMKHNMKYFSAFFNRVVKVVESKVISQNRESFRALFRNYKDSKASNQAKEKKGQQRGNAKKELVVVEKSKHQRPAFGIGSKTKRISKKDLTPTRTPPTKITANSKSGNSNMIGSSTTSIKSIKSIKSMVSHKSRSRSNNNRTQPSVDLKNTTVVQYQMEKDISRMTRMIQAITEDSIKKNKQKKKAGKYQPREKSRGCSKDLSVGAKDEEIAEEETVQVLDVVKMSQEFKDTQDQMDMEREGQLTVHDMKFVVAEKTMSVENGKNLNPFALYSSKYNSKTNESGADLIPDYFSFQKNGELGELRGFDGDRQAKVGNPIDRQQHYRLDKVRISVDKENEQNRSGGLQNVEAERKITPLATLTSLVNLDNRTDKNPSKLIGEASEKTSQAKKVVDPKKKSAKRYQDESSSEGESSEMFNNLTIVKGSGEK